MFVQSLDPTDVLSGERAHEASADPSGVIVWVIPAIALSVLAIALVVRGWWRRSSARRGNVVVSNRDGAVWAKRASA